jgi:hypothetical protein
MHKCCQYVESSKTLRGKRQGLSLVQCAESVAWRYIFGEGEKVFRRVFHGSVENKFLVEKLWEKKNAAAEQPQ